MSNFRRRLLSEEVSSSEYITDGLVFNLDGTDKRAQGNYVWVDKVRQIGFTKGSGVTELSNGFKFINSYQSYLQGNNILGYDLPSPQNWTVECVYQPEFGSNYWGVIVGLADWSSAYNGAGICVTTQKSYSQPDICFSTSNRSKVHWNTLNQKLKSCSLNMGSEAFYLNGQRSTNSLGTGSAFSHNGNVSVGARSVSGSFSTSGHFVGSIYAIRVYNRLLSEEEIMHNYQIDVQKYNIPV